MSNCMKFLKFSKKIKLVCTSLFVLLILLVLPSKIVNACGPIYSFQGYSFINPRIIDLKAALAPFYLSVDELADEYLEQITITQQENLKEWRSRYCNQAELPDIDYLVYTSSIRELDQLRSAIVSPSLTLGMRLSTNTFAKYIYRNKCLETVDYLIFAKECEPYVGDLDPWKNEKRDIESMEFLIRKGLEDFEKVESHYIRLRYAFQIIRLIHYAKQFDRVIEMYDFLMPKIDNDPSIIEYWIESHRAGALMSLGRNVEASYIFSKVFSNCPSRREQAYLSFKLNSEQEWNDCLKLCQSDKERAALYAMRANSPYSNSIEEMYYIYDIDPLNHDLELLLVRELKKLEKDLLGLDFNDNRSSNKQLFDIPRENAGKIVKGLQGFVEKVLAENEIKNLGLWQMAKGYLELLTGNYYASSLSFDGASKKIKNDTLKEQLEIFETALKICSFKEVNDAIEKEAASLKKEELFLKYPDFNDFLGDKFARLYQEKGFPGKSFIMHHSLTELKPNPKLDIIEDLIAVARKPVKNRFERMMVSINNDSSTIENDLLDLKATYFLSEFQVEAAMQTYLEMDEARWDDYGVYNPFVERIRDCLRCPLPDTVAVVNKGELMRQLIDLEYKAKAEPRKASEYYYLLGIAYYNMTYFGYSWKTMDYFRSGSSLPRWNKNDKDDVVPNADFPFGNHENFNCSKALYYFDQARILAIDKNLAAKATFMAAKCEQNAHFAYGKERTYEYFNLLKKNYADTEFYEEAIAECKYFEAFLKK